MPVLERVVREVGQDPLDAQGVAGHQQTLSTPLTLDRAAHLVGQRLEGRRDPLAHGPQVHLLVVQQDDPASCREVSSRSASRASNRLSWFCSSSIGPRVVGRQGARLSCSRSAAIRTVVSGRAQLVGHVGDELLLHRRVSSRARRNWDWSVRGHVVEAQRELGQVVLAAHVASGPPGGRRRSAWAVRAASWTGATSHERHHRRQAGQPEDDEQPGHGGRVAHERQRLLLGGQREQLVQLVGPTPRTTSGAPTRKPGTAPGRRCSASSCRSTPGAGCPATISRIALGTLVSEIRFVPRSGVALSPAGLGGEHQHLEEARPAPRGRPWPPRRASMVRDAGRSSPWAGVASRIRCASLRAAVASARALVSIDPSTPVEMLPRARA